MDALLAVEAHRASDAAGALEPGGVAVRTVRTVHAAKSVRPCSRHDGVHDGMPPVPWIDFVVRIDGASASGRHLHRGGVVARTEDECLESGRRTGDLARVQKAVCRFNLRLDPDPFR